MDSLTSGFNISDDLTRVLRYHEIAGFTKDEVRSLIDETLPSHNGADALLNDLEKLYGGYQFCKEGESRLFNSEMVSYYLNSCFWTGKPPEDVVDRNIYSDFSNLKNITSLVVLSGSSARKNADLENRKEAIAKAMSGELLPVDLTSVYTLGKFDYNDHLSFLFYTRIFDNVAVIRQPDAVVHA
jgi:hypothetical protein